MQNACADSGRQTQNRTPVLTANIFYYKWCGFMPQDSQVSMNLASEEKQTPNALSLDINQLLTLVTVIE